MYYSAQCLQTGRIMASGRNSKTKQECINAVIDYVNSDAMGDDVLLEPTEANFLAAEFEFFEHEEELEEDY